MLETLTIPDSYDPHSGLLDLPYIGHFIINSQARYNGDIDKTSSEKKDISKWFAPTNTITIGNPIESAGKSSLFKDKFCVLE